MRPFLLSILALTFAAPAAWASEVATQTFTLENGQTSTNRLIRPVGGSLVIQPDGRPDEITLRIEPEQRPLYEKLISQWRFEPVIEDGQAVPTKTNFALYVYGDLIPRTRRMRFGISDVVFTDPIAAAPELEPNTALAPPTFPRSMAARGLGAILMLHLKLDADGRVTEMGVDDLDLLLSSVRNEEVAQKVAKAFVDATYRAARDWRIADADALEHGSVFVPVRFSPPGTTGTSWVPQLKMAATPLPWMLEARATAQARESSGQPTSSVARLISPQYPSTSLTAEHRPDDSAP